jgi:hypothetical protein
MLQAAILMFAMCATPIGGPMKVIDTCTALGECVCDLPASQIRYKPEASAERSCRDLVGREQYEGEGRSHEGQMNVHRFSDCMMQK